MNYLDFIAENEERYRIVMFFLIVFMFASGLFFGLQLYNSKTSLSEHPSIEGTVANLRMAPILDKSRFAFNSNSQIEREAYRIELISFKLEAIVIREKFPDYWDSVVQNIMLGDRLKIYYNLQDSVGIYPVQIERNKQIIIPFEKRVSEITTGYIFYFIIFISCFAMAISLSKKRFSKK